MKLAILGGTFNPVHNGHLIIAEQVRYMLDMDKIIFIPAYKPPHKIIKPEDSIDSVHRVNMLRLAVQDNDYFMTDDYEISRKGVSYTYNTLLYLYENYDIEGKIHVIIGSDLLSELNTWYNYEKLIDLCIFTAVSRNNLNPQSYMGRYPFIKILETNVGMDISSTEIRRRFAEGVSLKYLIPDPVLEYIYKNKLYT